MKIYRDTWWYECKWVVIVFTEADSCAFCLWGRLIPCCLSLQGSVTFVLRWDKNAALTFEATVLAAPVKSHLHELYTNSALFALFHFLLLAHVSLPRLIRQVLRFVFLLCCFRKGSDLTSTERQSSQLVSVTCCAVFIPTALYITQCQPSALHPIILQFEVVC